MQKFNKFTLVAAFFLAAFSMNAQAFFTETFDGALPDTWSAVEVTGNGQTASNWFWTTDGPTGAFAIASLESTTASNGWMIFDGDLNCSGSQEAWLISPSVDCSDKTNVYLLFETFYRKYQDNVYVMVGTDLNDLTSWAEYPLFSSVAVNSYGDGESGASSAANPQMVDVDISEQAANNAGVYFAFRFVGGCDYSWQIDDVTLTDVDPRPAVDLRVNSFFATATTALCPLDQVDPIYFLADVSNIGSQDQDSVVLTATVEKDDTEIFTASYDYGVIQSDSTIENQLFAESFTPTETGIYKVTYSLAGTNADEVPNNNEKTHFFIVTDSTFARSLTLPQTNRPGFSDGQQHIWSYGTHYHVAQGAGKYSKTLSFYVGDNSDAGETIIFNLYKWTEADTEGIASRQISETERETIGYIFYEVTGNEQSSQQITLPFTSLAGGPIELEDNTEYVINMEYTPTGPGKDITIGFARDLDYSAVDFLHQQYLNQIREAEFLTILGDGGDLSTADFGLTSFGKDFTPDLTWVISPDLGSNTDNILGEDNKIQVNPNPAIDNAVVSMELAELSSNVRVSILDLSGRRVATQNATNFQNGQINFDVTSLQAGLYFVNITTDKGMATRQLTVIK